MTKMKFALLLLCAATFMGLPSRSLAQQKSFTIEQVLSDPFPVEMTPAPSGGKLAWIQNARGVRNIWIAEPAGGEYKSRQLTSYTDDDGVDIAQLRWTPDAQTIVYARGADFEGGHEDPNPASFAIGVTQGIWAISISGGQPRYLGQGRDPVVSPKGDRVAFIFKGHVWLVDIDAHEKAAQIIQVQGASDSLLWSPDGSQLAFVSHRTEHSIIAVYSFAGKTIRYLDASVDKDAEPIWSPDGKQIAFQRLPASSRRTYGAGDRRKGEPWSIRVADVSTGVGRQVWKADDGDGSVFREITAATQLLWGAGDHIIFPWERDGWTHLYSVPLSGGSAQLLTPGEFEVEEASLSPDRKDVIFNSNQDDIDRRHLWKVGVAGGRPAALTHGDGIEWSPVMTSEGKIALFHSDARHPARAAILSGSGDAHDLAPQSMPADFPSDALVVPQQVIIQAADGMKIHCQLFLPPNDSAGRHPAVLFFHGGSRREMLLGWHYMDYYHNAYGMNQYLASKGFVVMSVNYRSGIGYGMKFREALNYGAAGASEFNDVLGAGLYLRGRSDVEPNHIGLWGGSYGGYLTAMGLARASDLFAAGVDFHGVHNWNESIAHRFPTEDLLANEAAARLAYESSPIASVSTWRSPVLLIQGDDDRNVPFIEMIHLTEALRKQGVYFEQLVFPDEIHDFLRYHTWTEAYHATEKFLHEHLASATH